MTAREDLELCNRCLVQPNAAMFPVARKDGKPDEPWRGGSVKALADWAWDKITSGYRIESYDLTRTFEPVSTWLGDPVCEPHLYEMVMRDYGQG
jgi:hypothetical protein